MIPLRDHLASTRVPYVTYTIVAANVLVFLWQLGLGSPGGQHAIYGLGAIPAVIFGDARLPEGFAMVPAWATVFTSMFLHGGWFHIIGNMLYLWIFGDNVEDSMGHFRFLVFYLLCGVAAVLAQSPSEVYSANS